MGNVSKAMMGAFETLDALEHNVWEKQQVTLQELHADPFDFWGDHADDAAAIAMFHGIEKANDNKLTARELKVYLAGQGWARELVAGEDLFWQQQFGAYDTTGDSTVDQEEFVVLYRDLLKPIVPQEASRPSTAGRVSRPGPTPPLEPTLLAEGSLPTTTPHSEPELLARNAAFFGGMDVNKNGYAGKEEFVVYWLAYWAEAPQLIFDKGVARFYAAGQRLKQHRLMEAEAGSDKGRRAFLGAATRVIEVLFLYDAVLAERRQAKAFHAIKRAYFAERGRQAAAMVSRLGAAFT